MLRIKKRAFLVVPSDLEAWQMPERYENAMTDHVECDPTVFLLPCSIDLIPHIGEKVTFTGMVVMEEFVVAEIMYWQDKKSGITVRIMLQQIGEERRQLNEHVLVSASEEGFLFEDEVPISKVLRKAGLPTTRKGLEKVGKTLK